MGCASLFCSGVCAWSDVTPSADRGLTTDASARHSADLLQCLLLSPKRTLRAINMISAKCLPLSGQGRARRGLMLLSFELSNRSSYCELVSASSSKAVCSSLRQRSTKNRSSAVRCVCKILRYLSMLVLCANNKLFCMSDAIIHSVVADDRYRRVRAIVMLETRLPGDRSETD